jgi:DNA-binding GntR family transcriptional regulator
MSKKGTYFVLQTGKKVLGFSVSAPQKRHRLVGDTDELGKEYNCMINLQSLREQVYKYFRDEMHNGRILPNAVLNLNEISKDLGVSKTPLRDALIKLETEGFVTILPRRGVIVKPLTIEDVKDFYQIIGAIEGQIIKEVFARLGATQISTMRQLNSEMRAALQVNAFEAYYKINLSFHNTFLNLSDNNHLQGFLMPMKQRLYDFQQRPYVKDWELRNCVEHDELLDLIKQGNCAGAVHCIRDIHWSFKVQEKYIREFYRIRRNTDLSERKER